MSETDDDDGLVRISLRMPRALHERLTSAAKASSRSMNADIVTRLEASFGDVLTRLAALEDLVFDEDYGNRSLFDQMGREVTDLEDRLQSYFKRNR